MSEYRDSTPLDLDKHSSWSAERWGLGWGQEMAAWVGVCGKRP